MNNLTKEDFPHESYWTLYTLFEELPTRIDSSNESEFIQLPDAVKLAVALNWNFGEPQIKGCNLPTHYNYMVGRVVEVMSRKLSGS